MFYRISTDHSKKVIGLENQFSAPFSAPCWIVGGGPSMTSEHSELIRKSPCPTFAVNLAGTKWLQPTFWTSYDPTSRFSKSTYLNPAIMKFVQESRAMDVVPESTVKVCECPNLFFISRDKTKGYTDFPGRTGTEICDWQDSLIQSIDIAYRLGFRTLFLAGTDMVIRPSQRCVKQALSLGVKYTQFELLKDFFKRCKNAGMSSNDLEKQGVGTQYHFNESKAMTAAVQTDFHYFRVAQYLRLSRVAIAQAGLQIYVVNSRSRLSPFFPTITIKNAIQRIHRLVGDPASEETIGRYTQERCNQHSQYQLMQDFRPHFWNKGEKAGLEEQNIALREQKFANLKAKLDLKTDDLIYLE